jgi:hypothetical protein
MAFVGLVIGILAGCLRVGYHSGDAGSSPPPDDLQVTDSQSLDAAVDLAVDHPPPQDLQPLDALVPDLPWPGGGGCLFEGFTSGMGPVQPDSGSWALAADALRQSATGAGNYAVINGVTAADYFVEASITVHQSFPKLGWTEGASLGVRFQGGTDETPRQYLCGVYPGSNGLVVVHCSGGNPNNTCKVQQTTGPPVSTGQPWLVRATVVGNQLTCELPQVGAKLTHAMGLSSGGPTLITQYADASYDDLKVCPLSP